MHEYELLIETINPCGGEAHAKKEFKEVFAESKKSVPARLPERIFLWNGIIHGSVLLHIFLQLFKKAFLFGLGVLAAVL